ncbi:ribosomal RNA small subunit methyltransferase I isoform X4 [Capsicum annuum]|uniref:ribosomal RNA small subunit methyltransferase I isoform X4 n=1 Tax=Capsicum annuum TaxID=4072 RepID=UPI001FB13C88|nr:ribosomal RNA small subunit methyltransferase I isoform X4 [Capsicum annuum]
MLLRLYNPMSILSSSMFTQIPRQFYKCPLPLFTHSVQPHISTFPRHFTLSFYSNNAHTSNTEAPDDLQLHLSNSKQSPLKPGLYLVGTPIGNLEDITLRALRVLKSADVILSEDTRHSGKLLHYYNIKTPLLSYHKFNESQRAQVVLRKLQDGEIVALISDAGTPGISDPGMELAKLCADKNIPVVPIPGPSAVVTALSASGLPTNEFTFVGFLPKHSSSRRERLILSANESATQIFFIPPHKLCQFLEEAAAIFGKTRQCVMAREMTKVHEEAFLAHQPKGEITFLIEGKSISTEESPSESQLENELRELISEGHSLSMAVKLVASGKLMKRKAIYSLALRKFGGQVESEDD